MTQDLELENVESAVDNLDPSYPTETDTEENRETPTLVTVTADVHTNETVPMSPSLYSDASCDDKVDHNAVSSELSEAENVSAEENEEVHFVSLFIYFISSLQKSSA